MTTLEYHRIWAVIRRVIQAFPDPPTKFTLLTQYINGASGSRSISVLYTEIFKEMQGFELPRKREWEMDIGKSVPSKTWAYCCSQVQDAPLTYRHKLIQFKYLHHLYYTPERIAKFKSDVVIKCKKCGAPNVG